MLFDPDNFLLSFYLLMALGHWFSVNLFFEAKDVSWAHLVISFLWPLVLLCALLFLLFKPFISEE